MAVNSVLLMYPSAGLGPAVMLRVCQRYEMGLRARRVLLRVSEFLFVIMSLCPSVCVVQRSRGLRLKLPDVWRWDSDEKMECDT